MKKFVYLILIFLIGCSTQNAINQSQNDESGLTLKQAKHRKSVVSNVSYKLALDLYAEKTDYFGTSIIEFDLQDVDQDLQVDFSGGQILFLQINKKEFRYSNYDGKSIVLPKMHLKQGANQVVVRYQHKYSTTGAGFYRFEDPKDKEVYVYTDFEPFEANQLFPSFDQPDLKATYTLQVSAPAHWQVISATKESRVSLPNQGRKMWLFPKSLKFSTYIFSLVAGPYQVWEDQIGDVPLRLFARESLAKYVDHKEWFKITKQGFQFYQRYFDYPYAFKKYDQILVPDFNAGAMENVGAVTFNEGRYVHRGEPTEIQREKRANVILHELAHMWFGNLVTMKWWDDLWLNESFASYMAAMALNEATEFKQAWQSFHLGMKRWAYWEDQLVTTHPIAVPVHNTDEAFTNFDGITYGKGASVLKQLSFFLGADYFRDGVRAYFKKYAFKNAELKDFIAELAKASGQDLSNWTGPWLKTAGLNTVQAKYRCQDGEIDSFKLVQSSSLDHQTLREHRTKVAFYDIMAGMLKLREIIPVTYKGEMTSVETIRRKSCPDFVYPNYGGEDYVKVRLDENSLKIARTHLTTVAEPLVRAMLWNVFWERLRDGLMAATDYLDLVLNHLPKESDFRNAEKVAQTIYGQKSFHVSLMFYAPKLAPSERLEGFFWSLFEKAKPNSDFKKLWFDSYVKVAKSQLAQNRLIAIAREKSGLFGLKLDQDRRWQVLWQLNFNNVTDAVSLTKSELKSDSSHAGKKMALAASVIRPDAKNKQDWFDKIVSADTKMTLAELRSAMESMYPMNQLDLRPQYSKAFYTNLTKLSAKKENEFLRRFTASMVPISCTHESVSELGNYINNHKHLPPIVLKNLKVAKQEDERCVKIRQLAQ